jgi:hypothetical protein
MKRLGTQSARLGVGRLRGRGAIERLGLAFHRRGLGAEAVEAESLHQPYRTPGAEVGDMLAPDRQDEVAVTRAVTLDQPAPMLVLLGRHRVEDGGGGGIGLAKPLRVERVDAGILLLGGDSKGEYLRAGEASGVNPADVSRAGAFR